MKKCRLVNEESNIDILVMSSYLMAFRDPNFKKEWGDYSPYGLMEYQDGYCRFCPSDRDWRRAGHYYLQRLTKEPAFRQRLIKKVERYGQKTFILCRNVENKPLLEFDRKIIAADIKALFAAILTNNVPGFIIPIVELPYELLTQHLFKLVSKKTGGRETMKTLNQLLTPVSYTHALREKEAVFRLAKKLKNNKSAYKFFSHHSAAKIISNIKKFDAAIFKEIDRIRQKYCWIYFNYCGPVLSLAHLIIELQELILDRKKYRALDTVLKQKKMAPKIKSKLFKKYKFKAEEISLIKDATTFMSHKVFRKEVNSRAAFLVYRILEKFRKKWSLTRRQLEYLAPIECLDLLLNRKKISPKILDERYHYSVYAWTPRGYQIYVGRKARQLMRKYLIEEKIKQKTQEIIGQTACLGSGGLIRGIVRIINLKRDLKKMKNNDILVSVATTPELVPAMKKAAAIITDHGGLTCHAAIVSRELNKPCLIGTHLATKVLKDGDLVEVDANKGIVRKL